MHSLKYIIYSFLIVLTIFLYPPVTHAVTPCLSTDYCPIGEVCLLDSALKTKTCQSGPDSCDVTECGNGYSCDPTSKACKKDFAEGVPIGATFQNNFTAFNAPTTFGGFLTNISGQIYIVALILMLIYLIWGSYRYMISAGIPDAVISARKHIMWAIIGQIIIFISYWLFLLVNAVLLSAFRF